MCKGPGRVERAIIDAVDANPSAVFDMRQLAASAYPILVEPEKKHLVTLRRSARSLAAKFGVYEFISVERKGGLFVNAENVRSLAIGRTFAHFRGEKTVAECVAMFDDPGSEAFAEARPGGYFALLADRNRLQADGRDDQAAVLQERINAIVEAERQRRPVGARKHQPGATA